MYNQQFNNFHFGFANKVFNGYRPTFSNNAAEKMKVLIFNSWVEKAFFV